MTWPLPLFKMVATNYQAPLWKQVVASKQSTDTCQPQTRVYAGLLRSLNGLGLILARWKVYGRHKAQKERKKLQHCLNKKGSITLKEDLKKRHLWGAGSKLWAGKVSLVVWFLLCSRKQDCSVFYKNMQWRHRAPSNSPASWSNLQDPKFLASHSGQKKQQHFSNTD